ncbi:MAG: hypothetical protein DRQ64_08410, partial [Gammaproteobacteria bacterium]
MVSALLNWLASHESSLSAIAALIAIIAGVAVAFRLIWTRMPSQVMSQVKRPAFLSDWRNVGLLGLTALALLLMTILALGPDSSEQNEDGNLAGGGKPSVAVLPLNNISGDPEQSYLADGIAEDIITLLSRNPRFFVIARNSSFTYKGKAVDIRQVGEELGARYVVEGSVRKTGEQLRVTVQLIDTTTGQHIWAEQYDRPFAKIFELQDEITNGIAVALGDQIFTAEIARASGTSTDNLDAWGLVTRARGSLMNYNSDSTMESEQLLREALAADPDYALAQAELAHILCLRAASRFSKHPAEDIAEAYTLTKAAMARAPNDPLVLHDIGFCYSMTGRREEGIRLLEKAIVKQPNNALGLSVLGSALLRDDQAERALPYLESALQL